MAAKLWIECSRVAGVRHVMLWVLAAVTVGGHSVATAQQPCELNRLPMIPGAYFAPGAGISGDCIVVGDPSDGTMGQAAGAAYIFRRKPGLLSWELHQKVIGSGVSFQDTFGQSVAIEGDRVVVGAPNFDLEGSDFGFAYVFRRVGDNWVEEQKLVSSGSADDDSFGASVAISGDWIAVGAPGQADYFGRVVVFRWNGSSFVEVATLVGSDTVRWDGFGSVVSIRENRLVVGAGTANHEQGKAYVFQNDGMSWVEEAVITASDGSQGDRFGDAVTLDGDFLVVGAAGADGAAPISGAVYAYRFSGDGWGNEQKLVAPDPRPFDVPQFGASVALNGRFLLIGASHDDDRGQDAGSVYMFERIEDLWLPRNEFYAEESFAGTYFGNAVTFDGSYAIVGALSATYVYAVPNCIPVMGTLGFCVLAGLLVIASIALLKRRKLCTAHQDDS